MKKQYSHAGGSTQMSFWLVVEHSSRCVKKPRQELRALSPFTNLQWKDCLPDKSFFDVKCLMAWYIKAQNGKQVSTDIIWLMFSAELNEHRMSQVQQYAAADEQHTLCSERCVWEIYQIRRISLNKDEVASSHIF